MQRFLAADQGGDRQAAEAALQRGLEAHPDDVPLLLAAAELYLRSEPPEHYKPRLALHYAMRADKAAHFQSPQAAATFHRAQRATGFGHTSGERALLETVARMAGQDPRDVELLAPVDPDLLDPTLANYLEQARRAKARNTPACGEGLRHVPPGRYPLDPEPVEVEGFCIEERAAADPIRFDDPLRRADACSARGRRGCRPAERAVACGPLATLFADHPACVDRSVLRCCEDLAAH
jgi:hypothetical protein